MQVSIETTNGLERRMTIVVPSDSFEKEITERLKQAASRARLAGFRPGKVPLKEIRRRFGRSVRQEVAGELMQHSFVEAVQQEDVAPAASPSLEVLNMEPGDDFEFTATFEVFPQIALASFETVEVRRPVAAIAEADVDRMVETLREQRKRWEPVSRPAQEGDQVTVDFTGTMGGEGFEGNSGEDVRFVIGQGHMIEDFDQGVLGSEAGQSVEFDATFPEDYRSELLRGNTVHFEVTVKAVAEPRLPDLDEEFFEAFGVKEGGLEAFRAEIASNMERELAGAVRGQVKRQVLDGLERIHEVQLPVGMVRREIESLRQQMAQQMTQYARDATHGGELPSLPDDMFTEEAERRVKIGLIVNEIIESRELEADPDRVRARIEELAEPYGQPEQVINWYYGNEQQLNQVRMAVLEDQVVECVLENATVEELPSNYDDIVAGRTLPHLHDHDHDHDDPGDTEDPEGTALKNA